MPGTLGLTIASGVDMPRLALAALRGQPVPAQARTSASGPWSASSTSASSIPPRSSTSAATSRVAGMSRSRRFDEDFHVHSTFSDDAVSTLAENVRAARERGLRTLCLVDHVRRDTAWVPEFTAAVARLPGPAGAAGPGRRRGQDPRHRRAGLTCRRAWTTASTWC